MTGIAFPHQPGVHCSSSSIAAILAFDGFRASEAMVFGLGGGLGFFYCDDARYSPRHRFNGRALDLEGTFYRLFGHELAWHGQWRPEAIEQSLAAGRPLIAQTDIAYLPYYEPVHFPMHGVVVAGWDGEAVRLADTFSTQLQRVPAEDFRAALVGEGCPMMRPYRIASVPRIEFRVEPPMIARAIGLAAREMLAPGHPDTGLPALRRLASEGRAWRDAADWKWSARFAYQAIEKRGTGGGGFRGLYARFLEQVAPALPWIDALEAAPRLRHIAGEWSGVAGLCKRAFVDDAPDELIAAAQALDRIADLESVLMGDLARAAAEPPLFGG